AHLSPSPLSLHDALPIFDHPRSARPLADGAARLVELVGTETAAAPSRSDRSARERTGIDDTPEIRAHLCHSCCAQLTRSPRHWRSEEHTSELQSPDHLVC